MTATATRPAASRPAASVDPGGSLSRRDARRLFRRFPTPWIIGGALLAAVVARVAIGRWAWRDLVVAAAILAFEPLTEWLIHVLVLHFRPRMVLGRRIDLFAAKKHRRHHADPRDIPLVFVPLRVLVPALVLALPAWLLVLRDLAPALTAVVTSLVMLLVYEWTHYLIHTSYRPQGRYYRFIWRAHRLHHFRNERYWFGVTVHLADQLLRTFPAKDAVPVSPTARTLGVE